MLDAENIERAQREDAEWRVARLHFQAHGNWLDASECPICRNETADPDAE